MTTGRSRGLTLLEMLVAMVITVMLVGLVTQLLYQAQRAEHLLSRQSPTARFEVLKVNWLREAMEATLPRPLGDPEALRGDRLELQAWTSAPIWVDPVGPLKVTWSVRRRGQGESAVSELWMSHVGEPDGLRLLAWPGHGGGWRYLDEGGQWRESWPPPPTPGSLRDLGSPRAIELETALPGLASIRFVPQASPLSLANRRQLEQ